MKQIIRLSAVAFLLFFSASCKKSTMTEEVEEPDPPVSLTEQLKNTVWAGEFMYDAGANINPQPFAVELGADGMLTWSDIESTRPGGTWVTKGDTVVITFPNNTWVSATVKDNEWSNFLSDPAAGVTVNRVRGTGAVNQDSLTGTHWEGVMEDNPLIIEFTGKGKLQYVYGMGVLAPLDYTSQGAAINFSWVGTLSSEKFLVVPDGTDAMKVMYRHVGGFPLPSTNYSVCNIYRKKI